MAFKALFNLIIKPSRFAFESHFVHFAELLAAEQLSQSPRAVELFDVKIKTFLTNIKIII